MRSGNEKSARQQRIDNYLKNNRKRVILALVLTILLGPLGLMYVSVVGGVVFLISAILLDSPLVLLVWVLTVLFAPFLAVAHNRKMRAYAELIARDDEDIEEGGPVVGMGTQTHRSPRKRTGGPTGQPGYRRSANMRQIVLDTETTGFKPLLGHRIIEIGCVELVERRPTGNNFHQYLKPDRIIDQGAVRVHGITNKFLADKPRFEDVVEDFIAYVEGAELIIHNAPYPQRSFRRRIYRCGVGAGGWLAGSH